jgi:SAM-dependent methyltransferase
VSDTDKAHFGLLRAFVARFMEDSAVRFPAPLPGALLLDIAPQDHAGAKPFLATGWTIHTADLEASANPTHVMDITVDNSATVPSSTYSAVVCTEVLEHTAQPFNGMRELARLLAPGGHLFLSVPCNFRIHGPLPDSWRFTEHGVRKLVESAGLELVQLLALEAPGRTLFPIDYAAVARKPAA